MADSEKKKKQLITARRLILNSPSISELKKLLEKFGLSDNGNDAMTIIAAVFYHISSYVNETEAILGRRTSDWLLKNTVDIESYIKIIADDKYLGSGKDIKHAKKMSEDIRTLLTKIQNAKKNA